MRKLGFLAVFVSMLGLVAIGCEPAKKKDAGKAADAKAGEMKGGDTKAEPAEGTPAATAADSK